MKYVIREILQNDEMENYFEIRLKWGILLPSVFSALRFSKLPKKFSQLDRGTQTKIIDLFIPERSGLPNTQWDMIIDPREKRFSELKFVTMRQVNAFLFLQFTKYNLKNHLLTKEFTKKDFKVDCVRTLVES